MSDYTATVAWQRDGAAFLDQRYSRGHHWTFDGGVEVPASSSPHSVPFPMSVAAAVDPEEALVAAVSSCHMLWFLSLAAKAGFTVDAYRDDAVGTMARNADGQMAFTTITLRPAVAFAGEHHPTGDALAALHHEAHALCDIANSIRSEVRCEPQQAAHASPPIDPVEEADEESFPASDPPSWSPGHPGRPSADAGPGH